MPAPPHQAPPDPSPGRPAPPLRTERPQRDRRARPRDWLRLGAVLLALLGAGLAVALLAPRERDAPAMVEHRRYLAGLGGRDTAAEAALPDLAPLGLRLEASAPAGRGHYGGYRGGGGCRLGLWRGAREEVPRRIPQGWRTALLASAGDALWLAAGPGMDPALLAAFAAALSTIPPRPAPLGDTPCPD